MDPPPHRRSGGRAPSGGAGAEPPVGGLGAKPPQKLKPKNTLEASQKALLIFAQFLYLQRVCANLLSVVSLIRPTHVSKIRSK